MHSAIFVLIGLAGAIFVLLFRRKSGTVAILIMALVPLLLLPISGHYGEELLHRIYLFTLPFMACFGAMLLDIKNKLSWLILCLLLIITVPTQVISLYGNQAIDYFSPAQSAELDFFHTYTTDGYVTGSNPLGWKQNAENYRHISFSYLHWQDEMLALDDALHEDLPHYVGISRYDTGWYEFLLGDTQFLKETKQLLNNSPEYNLIYDSQESQLWIRDRRT